MFKIRRIKALQDNTPSRNLANEFINEQGSCATLKQNWGEGLSHSDVFWKDCVTGLHYSRVTLCSSKNSQEIRELLSSWLNESKTSMVP